MFKTTNYLLFTIRRFTRSLVTGHWSLVFCLLLASCGTSAPHQTPKNISFPLPSALTKAASDSDLTATLIATNGTDSQTATLTISGGTVSGSITLAEGTWEFQLIFYITADSGNKLAVAFVLFGEVTISGDTWTLTFDNDDLLFETTSADISLPEGCLFLDDCDGDTYTNWAEFDAGSNPEDATSFPGATVCGNGTMETGEGCDDGNTTSGDGCSSSCVSEVCGNSVVDAGEGCDDGNTTAGDGCSDACQVETPSPVCGNGIAETGEECDDGNTTNGDGCSSSCVSEVITITINLTDGEAVQDAENVLADTTTTTGTIRRLIVSKSSGSALSDTNGASDAFDATWDTASDSVTEDSSVTLTFTAQDTEGNSATVAVSVTVDNTPNVTSFGTSALIQNGGSTSLTWTAGNYSSLSVDNSVGTLSGDSGSTSVSPTTTTTYTLTATRTGTSKTFTTTKTVTISVNHNPEFGGHTTPPTGDAPADGVSLSWSQSDTTDGLSDTVTGTVTLYSGTSCAAGDEIGTYSSTSGSVSPTGLEPRTDYSYSVSLADSNGGTATTSACQNFTTSDTGLVGWWRMDEGSGTTAEDSSGNGNDGTFQNTPSWTTNAFSNGSALAFNVDEGSWTADALSPDETNDIGDYIQIPDSESLNSPSDAVSIEAWIKWADNSNYNTILSKGYSTSGYLLRAYDNTCGPTTAAGISLPSTLISTWGECGEITNASWYHVVGIFNGTDLRIYVNGQLKNVAHDTETISANALPLYIGRLSTEGNTKDEYFQGLIDEVALYSRALTTQEIRDFCQLGEATAGITCAEDDVPAQLAPSNGTTLPPTRAFLSWEAGTVPTGKSIDHYHLCYVTDGSELGGDNCLNSTNLNDSFEVIESLTANNSGYLWKVRQCYGTDNSDCSSYTPVWSFSTDTSLVGWWKFDSYQYLGALPTRYTIYDSSENVVDGIAYLNAGGWGSSFAGTLDEYWIFGGTADWIEIPDQASLDGMLALTVEARIVNLDTSLGGRAIVAKTMDAPGSYVLRTGDNGDGKIIFTTETTNGSVYFESETAVTEGAWHHLVGTYDGSTQALTIDGVFDSSATQTGTINDSNHELCFGAYCKLWFDPPSVGGFFSGYIDEVAIYNEGLSDEQILNSYCAIEALAGTDPLPDDCL